MTTLALLPGDRVEFPPAHLALDEPDGLLCAGGELSVEWLLEAYTNGIFPWFNSDAEHILWWSPSQRGVIEPGAMKVSRSLRKTLRSERFDVSMDTAFAAVVEGCSGPRSQENGTWITQKMQRAYTQLHLAGYAHSVETRRDGELVGGLYGIALGKMFFGESMFSRATDASKVAFFALHQWLKFNGYTLIDCQMLNPHLASLGVKEIGRDQFLDQLNENALEPTPCDRWHFDSKLLAAAEPHIADCVTSAV